MDTSHADQSRSPNRGTPSKAEPLSRRPERVLVVDDAPSVRQRVIAAFRKAGGVSQVAEAGTGAEALEMAASFGPDLILLDMMLPDMSGVEVLEVLNATDPDIDTVVFTNYPYPAIRRKCSSLGVRGFFSKSTDIHEVLQTLGIGNPGGDDAKS